MSPGRRETLARLLHDALRRAADDPEEIGYETIEAYVDGRLGDVEREIVGGRLEDEPWLRDQVADLRALRVALADPPAEPRPAPPAGRPSGQLAAVAGVDVGALIAVIVAAALIALLVWNALRATTG
jgi:anti-sigma factor RsiW